MNWNFLIDGKDSLTVTTDSRKVTRGCVFVALKGEHFDGNDYVEQARHNGAEYVICGDNALAQLQDLARAWRRKLALPIIGVTGTNGKTTTKELTAAVLATRYKIHYTQGNYNNSLGVPLTVLQLNRSHELAVVENAHLQGFGSFEGVMQTKGELYDWLVAHNGSVFRNADNAYLTQMWSQAVDGKNWNGKEYIYHRDSMPTGTHLVGEYNAENIAAALCIGEVFGISRETGLQAIRDYVPSNNRSQAVQTKRNHLVVDAYNANYTSMQAALNCFDGDTYILGAMRELGDFSHTAHQNIVNMLLERKAQNVYLVGNEWKETTSPYPIYTSAEELKNLITQGDIRLEGHHILIKGSRSNRLEQLIEVL